MGAIAPPSRKCLPFLQENENGIILFVLGYVNFCSAKEKCYYLIILLKMFIATTKITQQVILFKCDRNIIMNGDLVGIFKALITIVMMFCFKKFTFTYILTYLYTCILTFYSIFLFRTYLTLN